MKKNILKINMINRKSLKNRFKKIEIDLKNSFKYKLNLIKI